MSIHKLILASAVLTLAFTSRLANAQEGASTDATGTAALSLDNDAAEAATEEEAGSDTTTAAPLTLAPGKAAELDMSALGGIDPSADLAGANLTAEDKAKTEKVESWTERELELLELHGYFRVRPELYHKFRIRADDYLYDRAQINKVDRAAELGDDCRDAGGKQRASCKNNTLAGANLRLRVEPTLNISEEVMIKAQIDFLDNVMLGSTPRYYQNWNFGDSNHTSSTMDTYAVQGWNMGPPSSDMIAVRRAWGEVMTPLGQLRFGRMGDHWGLGMLHNAGNGIDDDFGDTVDRLTFATRVKDWLLAPAFDFPNEGKSAVDASGRPFDVEQLDDAYQLSAIIAYKHDEEEQLAMLRRGDWLINTGLYFTYRWQVLSFEETTNLETGAPTGESHFFRRDMWQITPDFWFQFLVGTFHLELEAALIYGELGNPDRDLQDFNQARSLKLVQWGGVLQGDYGLLSDQLRIGVEVGFASGDKDVDSLRAPSTFDQLNKPSDATFSQFAFNPAYNTDFILYQHILGSVSGTYYFHPWVRYDFIKSPLGKRLSLQGDVQYTRAEWANSTISNNSGNLGVELNASVMFVTEDHFHAGLKYGVLFPLKGFQGMPYVEQGTEDTTPYRNSIDLAIPQTLQVMLGISY